MGDLQTRVKYPEFRQNAEFLGQWVGNFLGPPCLQPTQNLIVLR